MRKIITTLLLLLVPASTLIEHAIPVNAASTGNVTGLEVIAPATARVGEAFDITVRAIDSNKNVVSSYRGSIIFMSANIGDVVPAPNKSIAFTAEDAGEKKFSKGVTFKSPGKQKILVTDITDDAITGEAIVNVSSSTGTTEPAQNETVTIITPENNAKITSDTVTVSGNTRKNSKVSIKLNGALAATTTTDSSGIFSKSISGVTQETNIIIAEVLDAEGKVIGTSQNIAVGKVDSSVNIINVTVSPSTTVEISSPITFNIEADPGMKNVSLLIDGSSIAAKEGSPGKYSASTVAPAKADTYAVTISATNTLGSTSTRSGAVQLTVTNPAAPPPKVATFKNVQVLTDLSGKVNFTFGVNNAPVDLEKFKIVYGDGPDSFSSEVITNQATKIIGTDGLYHWYVDKLEPKTYYFKIFGMRADGTIMDALSSEPVSATVGKNGCTIGNVGKVSVETLSDKSILSWEAVPNVVAYNIYKVSAAGDLTLFQKVTDTRYVLFLSKGSVVYEDFAVKALCDGTTESSTPSTVSKVQTGPASLAFLVILSGILGAIILRRKAL